MEAWKLGWVRGADPNLDQGGLWRLLGEGETRDLGTSSGERSSTEKG